MSLTVDLRSDTVTRPTPEMYEAMLAAPLGDDVLGDEPTVQELEALSAEMLGKQAAMFVPSGSMGNQIALAVHTQPGDSALFEEEAHMIYYEGGAPGVIAQVVCRTVSAPGGVMEPEAVEAKLLRRSQHTPGTSVVCLENSHNRRGGAVIPVATMRAYREIADRWGIGIHLDGARIFNAATALELDARELAEHADTVNFCLSKALGSPVGSVLCGPQELITEARYWRKRLGGGMRQAGILAACGLVSLRTMIPRLADDHRRAKMVAAALSQVPGIDIDLSRVVTNIVMVDTQAPASEWVAALKERGVLAMAFAPNRIRLVFHHQVEDEAARRAVQAFASSASSRRVPTA